MGVGIVIAQFHGVHLAGDIAAQRFHHAGGQAGHAEAL